MMFTTFFNMVAEHLSQGAMMLQQAGWTKIFPWSMMVFMSVREVCASNLQNLQQMAEQTVAASSGALDALSSGRWQQELFLFAVLVFMSSILAGMAWSFLREIATEEREIETVAHEEFMPDVYIAKSRTAVHKHRECRGLDSADQAQVVRAPGCRVCFPDGYVYIQGQTEVKRRRFTQMTGCGFWMRVLCSAVLLLCAGLVTAEGWLLMIKNVKAKAARSSTEILLDEAELVMSKPLPRNSISLQDDLKTIALEDEHAEVQHATHALGGSSKNVHVRREREETEHVELMSFSLQRRQTKEAPIRYEDQDNEENYNLEIVKYMIAGFEASRNFDITNLKIEVKRWYEGTRRFLRSLESSYAPEISVMFHKQKEIIFVLLMIVMCTPIGLVTWISLYNMCAIQSKRKECFKRRVSRRARYQEVRACGVQKKTLMFIVLLYTNTQAAEAMNAQMEQAMQSLAQQTATNTQQINDLVSAVQQQASQQQQASTAAQNAAAASEGEMREMFRNMLQVATRTSTAVHEAASMINNMGQMHRDFREHQEAREQAQAEREKRREKGDVELHKMIKTPDVFNPSSFKEEHEGWSEFRHKMRTWIGALDPEMLARIEAVEAKRSEAVEFSTLSDEHKAVSKKLYTILTSYTKGRPLRTIKQITEENGLEAWRILLEEHEPYTRGRSLRLLTSLTKYKFENKKTTMENILAFEEAIEQYEKASGDVVQDDLKISIILNQQDGQLRQVNFDNTCCST